MAETLAQHRQRIRELKHADEPAFVAALLERADLDDGARAAVQGDAVALVEACRERQDEAGTLDAFLQEFGLSNAEGIALMCLAEALLRVNDEDTADRLIAEKIHSGDWGAHKGRSASRFVNASVWGLMLTGKIVRLEDDITERTGSWVRGLTSRLGEPVVRRAVLQAMRIMGSQYVLGRHIQEAIRAGREENRRGTRFSFDMLGEGARTDADARRYLDAYAEAIDAIGALRRGADIRAADGISVKLSALHPRYAVRQQGRVMAELLPRARQLALLARDARIGFSIDAEECDRLDLSLDMFEALARDPALADWDGLGFVLQAYQKRALAVSEWLIDLARDTGHRFMVRLVKGAYWDSEIKHAQEQGFTDYPVFTRKCHTDLSYECCAASLLSAPDAVYPQFATHNAHTVATVRRLAGPDGDYEFQRLHGMGQLLYDELGERSPQLPLRVYAPVGNHRDLLPYLVRRLLENGANSSFVNRFLDARVAPADLLRDPAQETRRLGVGRHTRIAPPRQLYRDEEAPWLNARGVDLADPDAAAALQQAAGSVGDRLAAAPIVDGHWRSGVARDVTNPARTDTVIGSVVEADAAAVDAALGSAVAAQPGWDRRGASARGDILEAAAGLFEEHLAELVGLLAVEAGRTLDDGVSEVREAVDFLRYYARQAQLQCPPRRLPGPTGEVNELSLHGRGVFLCISPWNFPLAIFTGQVAAALAVGNAVVAKPAEQTPIVAARAVTLLHRAGIPVDVLHLLPGDGAQLGALLLPDPRVAGVAFTGSTATAHLINRQLAQREGPILPLIAETGGLNVMLVDGTALPEQVVDDVIVSAFQSAGQRCSALRVLYLQEDIADRVLTMLAGAMRELSIGDPALLSTDIGPVIDLDARQMLERHAQRMDREATLLAKCAALDAHRAGFFFPPRVYEIESLGQLEGEVFGPILHVIRYRVEQLPQVLADINASGYGLTLGVHSRIDGFARDVFRSTRVGNTYINRNMVGAIVGVNPFGGQGLSGTGPKAGGPHYLARYATEKTRTDNVVARGGNAQLFNLGDGAV